MHGMINSSYLLSISLAGLGLFFGSFATSLIHRLPQEEPAKRSITKPTVCPHCAIVLRPLHRIPILSWVFLGGRCAYCNSRISYRYPLVEFLVALLFASSSWILPFGTLIWLKGLICGYSLIVLFFTDLTEMILPDVIQLPLALLGLLFTLPQILRPNALLDLSSIGGNAHAMAFYNGLQPSFAFHRLTPPITWGQSLLGLVVGYLFPVLLNAVYKAIRKSDGLGMGVFKMLGWLGAFWGWATALSIFGLAICLAIPILMFALRRPKGPTMMPFGSFLAVATPLVLFFGPK